jgi:hypothetical protein
MISLQTFMTNLVLIKSSGPKRYAVAFTMPISPISVCYTDLSGKGGGGWDGPAKQSECLFTGLCGTFDEEW